MAAVFRGYSGKFCCAVDETTSGFRWTVTVADNTLSDDQPPVSEGNASTMEEALAKAYRSMGTAIAGLGGHESEAAE